jgi:hypothetical protein
MDDIFLSQEWNAISLFYGNKKASRSKIPLINHIIEGISILDFLKSDYETMGAFCLHPLFQNNEELITVGKEFITLRGFKNTVYLAMEYRGIANAYLPKDVFPKNGIKLSPILEVNQMLIANKIQNRKDFDSNKFMYSNKGRLEEYFNEWFTALGITENFYKEAIEKID